MPKDLSRRHPSTSMTTFYTAIHEQMAKSEPTAGARPTVVELVATLDRTPLAAHRIGLDAGCGGTLSLSLAFAERGHRVEAVDLSHSSLRHAQQLLERTGRRAIGLRRASVLDLPYAANVFDFAISSGVAHHTPDPPQAVRELHRTLKPGGLLYLSLYCFSGSIAEASVRVLRMVGDRVAFSTMHRRFGGNRVINNFVLDHMYVPVLWLFTAREVRAMLDQIGFTIVEEWPSVMDPFARHGAIGRLLTGDGLMRVWICRKRDGTGGS